MQTSSPSSVSEHLIILHSNFIFFFHQVQKADFYCFSLLNRFQLPPFETEDPSEQIQLIKEATQRHGVGISGYHFFCIIYLIVPNTC